MPRHLLLILVAASVLLCASAHPSTVRLSPLESLGATLSLPNGSLTVPSLPPQCGGESRGTGLRVRLQGESSGRARAPVEGQEPPAPAPLPEPAFDAEAVVAEVQAFYAEYRQAWEAHNALAIANHLAADFTAFQYVPRPAASSSSTR